MQLRGNLICRTVDIFHYIPIDFTVISEPYLGSFQCLKLVSVHVTSQLYVIGNINNNPQQIQVRIRVKGSLAILLFLMVLNLSSHHTLPGCLPRKR